MPKEEEKNIEEIKKPIAQVVEDTIEDDDLGPQFPTSINQNLKDLIDDNPNKLIGCGG